MAEHLLKKAVPCPFCGKTDLGFYDNVAAGTTAVFCNNCMCHGPTAKNKRGAADNWGQRSEIQSLLWLALQVDGFFESDLTIVESKIVTKLEKHGLVKIVKFDDEENVVEITPLCRDLRV